ncbi:sulfotransferase [Thermodesulfobacteriota bacterium]
MATMEQDLALAMQHINFGRLKEAEALCGPLLEKYSLEPQVLHAAGLIAYKKMDFKSAIEQMSKAVQIDKNNPLYFGNLGEAYRRDRQFDKAMEVFERAIEIMPEFLMGHLGIANTYRDQGKHKEAISRFRLALAINPTFAPAYNYLGLTLIDLERVKEAIPLIRKAVALRPGYIEAQLSLANALEMDGQSEEALARYRDLLEKMPKHVGILNNIGNILKNLGQIDEAVDHFEKALELDQDHVSAYYNLSRARVGTDPEDLERMEKMVKDDRLVQEQHCSMHFSLGKVYDDLGDYDKAFYHFKKGNELDTRDKPFDPRMHSLAVDRMMATFNQEFFSGRRGFGSESTLPVFVLGMPRSGTTLVEQTLASHPKVFGAGELNNIGQLVSALPQLQGKLAGYPECATLIDAISSCQLGEEYISYLRGVGGDAIRVTDKMPGNFINLGFISILLPNAKIIHCHREPLDTSLSCYFQHFAMVMPFSRDLSFLGSYYRDYKRIMDHWHKVAPLPILDVFYKDMVTDHEGMSRKIVEFVGLEWDDACLDFHKTERTVKTASNWQVRQPVYTSSIARWKNYDKFLGPLREALGDAQSEESRIISPPKKSKKAESDKGKKGDKKS